MAVIWRVNTYTMTCIRDQMHVLGQRAPIDLHPRCRPLAKTLRDLLVAHIHRQLIRFRVNCNGIAVCNPPYVPAVSPSNKPEDPPNSTYSAAVICVVAWQSHCLLHLGVYVALVGNMSAPCSTAIGPPTCASGVIWPIQTSCVSLQLGNVRTPIRTNDEPM